MALTRSIAFSILASLLATVLANRIFSISEPVETAERGRSRAPSTFVVVVPVLVGCSNNRIGWVKETHHHHHPLLGWARK